MPTYDEIFEKVQATLVDALGVDEEEVTREATLQGDLGAESIDFLDIVFRLERNFGIKIPRGELFPENLWPTRMGRRRQAHRQGRRGAEGPSSLRRPLQARRQSRRRPDRRPLHGRDAGSICAEQARGLSDACSARNHERGAGLGRAIQRGGCGGEGSAGWLHLAAARSDLGSFGGCSTQCDGSGSTSFWSFGADSLPGRSRT